MDYQDFIDACRHGQLDDVRAYLAIPANLDRVALNNNRALRNACYGGHLPIIKTLLSYKDVRDNAHVNGNEPLFTAISLEDISTGNAIADELLKLENVYESAHGDNNSLLAAACDAGQTKITNDLLRIEAVRKTAHVDNSFALQQACVSGNLAIVKELLAIEAVRKRAHR